MNAITVTPYKRQYLSTVRDLIFHSHWVHNHLDWHEYDQWLEAHSDAPMRLAWQRGRLVAMMAAAPPLNNSTWIRLAVIQNSLEHRTMLNLLWNDLLPELRGLGVTVAAVLGVRDWVLAYLPEMGFHYVEDIITLARSGKQIPPPRETRLSIRSAEWNDLEAMTIIDHAAFNPPWQLAGDELRQAHRISASCTVAFLDNVMVGYQLSTLYFDGAHLARLAVLPDMQGTGIGGALLGDVLERFFRRGVYHMTVNTQASNTRSQHLYTAYGFHRNGYDLPYWSANL
jgi:ribosomal protein S18 acetylase RimI-like enzyme